jgi:multicomponent Na+:H+ antiporter subunit B
MKKNKKINIVWFLKRFISIFLLLFFLKIMYNAFSGEIVSNSIGQILINKGYKESGAKNIVTAIYLDYRLYDTFFEALILMISVSGVALLSETKREENR